MGKTVTSKKRFKGRPSKSSLKTISDYLLDVYELAKSGISDRRIAELIGISYPTFKNKWLTRRVVRDALSRGRKPRESVENFKDYVYSQLDEDLKPVWEKIMEVDKGETPLCRLEAMLKSLGKGARQNLFIHALIHTNFNMSEALRLCNLPLTRVEQWIAQSPDFGKLLDQINWHKKNFFEGALTNLVKDGHPGAIIFVNKTVNSDRGYGPPKKTIDKNVNVNVAGGTENTNTIRLEDLDLPLDNRKALLTAIREKAKSNGAV